VGGATEKERVKVATESVSFPQGDDPSSGSAINGVSGMADEPSAVLHFELLKSEPVSDDVYRSKAVVESGLPRPDQILLRKLDDQAAVEVAQLDRWTTGEAVAVSLGWTPHELLLDQAKGLPGLLEAQQICRWLEIVVRAVQVGVLSEPLIPAKFLVWADSKLFPGDRPLEISAALRRAVFRDDPLFATWSDERGALLEKIKKLEAQVVDLEAQPKFTAWKRLNNISRLFYFLSIHFMAKEEVLSEGALADKLVEAFNGKHGFEPDRGSIRICLKEGKEQYQNYLKSRRARD
jgi:hypothetical protein